MRLGGGGGDGGGRLRGALSSGPPLSLLSLSVHGSLVSIVDLLQLRSISYVVLRACGEASIEKHGDDADTAYLQAFPDALDYLNVHPTT